jgi:SAM-dependent methyltransferase
MLRKDEMLVSLLGTSPCPPSWEYIVCDLCGADDSVFLFEKDTFYYVRCRRCGLVYVTPRLRDHQQQQDNFYNIVTNGNIEAAAEWDRRPERMRSLTRVARHYLTYKQTGAVLDVGCSFGAFLEAAESVGWKAYGLEVASKPAFIAARHHEVFHGFLSDAPYSPNSFDAVRLNNVIEHVSSPRAIMCDIRRVLRPGGLLYISTPNVGSFTAALQGVRWRYVQGGSHLYLFDLKTLGKLLEAEGFKIVRVSTPGIRLTDRNGNGEARPFFLRKLAWRAVKSTERVLDLTARITLRGHRLRVWAEKTA